MGFINLELKRELKLSEAKDFQLHEAIFEMDDPSSDFPEGKLISPAQRRSLEEFQQEAFRRIDAARSKQLPLNDLASSSGRPPDHSYTGPFLYRTIPI